MNERLDWIEDNTSLFIHKISKEEKLDKYEVRILVYGNYNHARVLEVDNVVIAEGRWANQVMIVFLFLNLRRIMPSIMIVPLQNFKKMNSGNKLLAKLNQLLLQRLNGEK